MIVAGVDAGHCVLCYATIGRWLWKNPGPGGLGHYVRHHGVWIPGVLPEEG